MNDKSELSNNNVVSSLDYNNVFRMKFEFTEAHL